MSDRVVVLEQGRVAQSGTPGDLYDRPASPYVADFIGTSNLIAGTVTASGDRELEASVGSHRLRAATGGRHFTAGDRVLLSIRPERALMLANGGAPPVQSNILPATIKEYMFHGSTMRMELDIGQKAPFFVDLQLQGALDSADLAKPGSAVSIAVAPVNVTVFPSGASS
jgi:ABC-type Fe3+/spermidine/putrescine transport system ATPase subunit